MKSGTGISFSRLQIICSNTIFIHSFYETIFIIALFVLYVISNI